MCVNQAGRRGKTDRLIQWYQGTNQMQGVQPQPVRRVEKWKVPKKRQWGLQKLGVGKDLARLTAYCGDSYYWIATKTCAVKTISKDVLAKAGLISYLDYYNERHTLKLR